MKFNFKNKIMLAVLAGGMLCANGALAAEPDYTIKQGGNKFDSGTTGSYSEQINGNTTDGGLSDTSYSGNEIIIRRGTYLGLINGASASDQSVSGNTITVYDGNFSCQILGGFTQDGDANNNEITLNDGAFNSINIGAGYTDSGNSNGNIVIINDGNFENYTSGNGIWGGYSSGNGNTNDNKVYVYDGTFSEYITFWGGCNYGSGEANNNYVEINDGNFAYNTQINGGLSRDGEATNNHVVIKDGTFNKCEIYGGVGNTNVSNNIVEILGGTFEGAFKIYGGDDGSSAQNNEVTISGGNFENASDFEIYGGDASATNGNKLNLKIKMGGKAGEVGYFQEMNFTLPANIQAGNTMLSTSMLYVVRNPSGSDTATINVDASNGVSLKAGESVTLLHADLAINTFNAGTISLGGADVAKIVFKVNDVEQENTSGMLSSMTDRLDIILVMLQDFEQKEPEPPQSNADKEKAPVEGIAATAAMINQSADLASNEGLNNLAQNTADGTFDTFGAVNANRSKYKTGSHVDMDGWGFLVGAGNTRNWKNGQKTTYGLFFEYGKGEFDTYNNDIHGEGDSNNKGVGIIARHTLNNNTYFDGAIRYGKQETEWEESEIGSYDTDSKYYGFSVGMGHIFEVDNNELDIYGRYTYGHSGSCDAKVGENEYEFDAVKSSRIRFGAKYNFVQQNKQIKPYIGLAWEREMKGESKATITGMGEAPAPSLKGNTGIMQAGCSWEAGKWTLGAEANAYIGKRKGWGGMFNAFYNF